MKQPHGRDTQRPNIMNHLVPPEAPDHMLLATLPCLPEQCNHCGKKFSRKSSMYNQMLVFHGASCFSNILTARQMPIQVDGTQKDQLRQLLHHLNAIIILSQQMNRDAHLLAPILFYILHILGSLQKSKIPWTYRCWGRICEGILVVAGLGLCRGPKPKRERGFTLVMSVTRLSGLCQRLARKKIGNTVAICLSAWVVARS